ncbi:hypothetical protein [Massilia sp. PWRC2]|uniref:hypothetical protein n=1 Tax=Massilia sp. PWRC2 TaxID=2804626 RepID=UPI003CF10882
MKKFSIGFAALLTLSTMGVAQADAGITASVGTTGAGLHVSVPVATALNARVGINGLSISRDGNTSDVDYDYKLKMATVDALLDYFPMAGGFRVSGGLAYNGNKIDVNGRPKSSGTYTLNGHVYPATAVGSLNGTVDFHKVAPYLGIGWGNAVAADKGWGFSTDIGVLFQGAPNASLSNRGCTAIAAVCSQIATDVAAESRSLQDDTSSFKAYPVLRLGVSYKF